MQTQKRNVTGGGGGGGGKQKEEDKIWNHLLKDYLGHPIS